MAERIAGTAGVTTAGPVVRWSGAGQTRWLRRPGPWATGAGARDDRSFGGTARERERARLAPRSAEEDGSYQDVEAELAVGILNTHPADRTGLRDRSAG
jgi:hypothetical protein